MEWRNVFGYVTAVGNPPQTIAGCGIDGVRAVFDGQIIVGEDQQII